MIRKKFSPLLQEAIKAFQNYNYDRSESIFKIDYKKRRKKTQTYILCLV